MVRRKINKKIQTGGKLIGSGGYGCVFKPTIPCDKCKTIDGEECKNDKDVSKLLTTRAMNEEIESLRIIDKIDPLKKYHIGNPEICEELGNIAHVKDLEKCENFDPFGEFSYGALNYEYGGKSLRDYGRDLLLRKELFLKGLIAIENLFEGVVHFIKRGFIHNDIKCDNILFDGDVMKFIDFGLSMTISEILEEKHSVYNSYNIYFAYPYYLYLLSYMRRVILGHNIDPNYISHTIVSNLKMALGTHCVVADLWTDYDVIDNNILILMDNPSEYYYKLLSLMPKIIDLYGLGIMLFNVIHYVTDLMPIPMNNLLTDLGKKLLAPIEVFIDDKGNVGIELSITAEQALESYRSIIKKSISNDWINIKHSDTITPPTDFGDGFISPATDSYKILGASNFGDMKPSPSTNSYKIIEDFGDMKYVPDAKKQSPSGGWSLSNISSIDKSRDRRRRRSMAPSRDIHD